MTGVTLTEFLLARIAEDEAAAQRAGSFTPWAETFQNDDYGHLTIQPARVLAECAAKRAIVEWHHPSDGRNRWCDYCKGTDRAEYPCETTRTLAAVYADHPDYREEWKP